jgi:ElaA protein
MNWVLKTYHQLTLDELYAILQLRAEVFIVEQNCPYLDLDNKDSKSYHLLGWEDNFLAAYTRILPAGLSFKEPSIGRVVTSPKARGKGAGRELMEKSIENLYHLFGKLNIRIGAQLYLKKFYASLGFEPVSPIYMEDGIEHVEMVKAP